jgi:hypothetical protein
MNPAPDPEPDHGTTGMRGPSNGPIAVAASRGWKRTPSDLAWDLADTTAAVIPSRSDPVR